jgi:hypothetical protein
MKSQTAPDDVMDDARDAARLELACVKRWVKEEDTRESVRATTRFPHNGEEVLKPDVLETGIDIRTVTVMSTDDESSLGEATLAIDQMWPKVEAMVHNANRRYEIMDNTLRPEQRLGKDMSLEEATLWIRGFDGYLTWNDSVIDGKSLECVRNLLENQLDASLISKLAEDESITETTAVQGPAGILSKLKGYFIVNSQQTANKRINGDQHGPRTTTDLSNPVHPTWIFQAYLKQVATLAERIELSISRWTKDKSESNGERTASELEELRTDMLAQLSNVGESWGEANDDDRWLQPDDAAEEKKTIARTVSNARSWGREALRKIREFRDESTAWRRKNNPTNPRHQERTKGADDRSPHVAAVSLTGATPKQQQNQLQHHTASKTATARPDKVQSTDHGPKWGGKWENATKFENWPKRPAEWNT